MSSGRVTAVESMRSMYVALVTAYGPQSWWPSRSSFETVIGAYLTQNTSWNNVERSIANLRADGALQIKAFRALTTERLMELIRPSGYMIRKAAALQAFVRFLDAEAAGSIEKLAAMPTRDLRDKLLALPGVGPETADAILLYALGHAVMVADEYMRRVVTRHRLARSDIRYDHLKALGEKVFAREKDQAVRRQHLNELHALLVQVGKTHCRSVARCDDCPLQPFLPHSVPLPLGKGDAARRTLKPNRAAERVLSTHGRAKSE